MTRFSGGAAGLAAAIMAAATVAVAPAFGHVQVRPTAVAPEDPVLFEVLVPNEEDVATTRVEVAVPKDVLPFSFETEPGWERRTSENADGSLRSIVWTGKLPPEGFARFSFLASTPGKEGPIAWKALQTYAGGKIVRWIGSPDSEHPAAVTRVGKDVPPQNAGGEGGGINAAEQPEPVPESDDGGGDGRDGVTLALAILGAVIGVVAIGLALTRRRGG